MTKSIHSLLVIILLFTATALNAQRFRSMPPTRPAPHPKKQAISRPKSGTHTTNKTKVEKKESDAIIGKNQAGVNNNASKTKVEKKESDAIIGKNQVGVNNASKTKVEKKESDAIIGKNQAGVNNNASKTKVEKKESEDFKMN